MTASPARGVSEQLQAGGMDALFVKSPTKEAHVRAVLEGLSAEALADLYTRFPIDAAARHLGVGVTALKLRCRQLGVPRWPHRQVRE